MLFHGFGGSWYVVEGVPLLEMRGYLYNPKAPWDVMGCENHVF